MTAKKSDIQDSIFPRGTNANPNENALVKVTCWCELETVGVPISDVRKGITGSCGLWSCRPPKGPRVAP